MNPINRREFIIKGGSGLAIAAGSSFWLDRLHAGEIPADSADFFEKRFGVARADMQKIINQALARGGEFAELYFQYTITHAINMEEDIIKDTSENVSVGVGIRVLSNEKTGYGYTNDLTIEAIKRAALTAAAITSQSTTIASNNLIVKKPNLQVYDLHRAFADERLQDKLTLVRESHDAAKKYDSRISKVRVTLGDSMSYITIANSEGLVISDQRPQSRL